LRIYSSGCLKTYRTSSLPRVDSLVNLNTLSQRSPPFFYLSITPFLLLDWGIHSNFLPSSPRIFSLFLLPLREGTPRTWVYFLFSHPFFLYLFTSCPPRQPQPGRSNFPSFTGRQACGYLSHSPPPPFHLLFFYTALAFLSAQPGLRSRRLDAPK